MKTLTIEEKLKRKTEIKLKLIEQFGKDIIKLIEKNMLDKIQRENEVKFNLNYPLIMEYKNIKL